MAVADTQVVSLASSLPTDKIVKVITGSFATASAARQQDEFASDVYSKVTIPHGFTRPVFTKLRWSVDNTNWVDGGLGQLQSAPLVQCITYSDSTNVVLLSTDLGTYTIYYQIICFWIDDYDTTNPLVDSFFAPDKPIAFDSRLNYQKIVQQGVATINGTSTITHNLGYKPNAWVYFESNTGQVWPVIIGGASNAWFYLYSTQKEIEYSISTSVINITTTGSCRVWYRIYGEGV